MIKILGESGVPPPYIGRVTFTLINPQNQMNFGVGYKIQETLMFKWDLFYA